VSDIFQEVEEDLRAERMRKLLQRYGGWLLAAALAVILATGAYQGWRYYQARERAQLAQEYLAAMRDADGPAGPGRQAALTAFQHLADSKFAGYRTLARLREAALQADGGNRAAALGLYDQVANDPAADPLLRDLASLLWAMRQVDDGDPGQVAARLGPLASPDNPWHALAQEQQALLQIRLGHNDAARDLLKRLAGDVTAPDGVRGRANGLLARLGGSAGG
jgi:hypothetical protein